MNTQTKMSAWLAICTWKILCDVSTDYFFTSCSSVFCEDEEGAAEMQVRNGQGLEIL